MVLLSGHSGFWIHPNKISSNQDWIYEMSTGRYDTSPASQRLLSIQAVIVISMNYSCSNQVWTIWHGQKFLQMNQICSGIIQLLQHCFVLMIREKPHSTKVVVLENVFLSNFRLHLIILFSTLPKAKSLEYPWLNTAVAYKAVDWTLRLIFLKNLNEESCFTTNNMWSRWHYCRLSCFSSVFENNFCLLFSA